MPFTLQITFSGLCMFVQRETKEPKGLFVLMPAFEMDGEKHHPVVQCDARYCKAGSVDNRRFSEIVRWGGLADHRSARPMPSMIAPVSKYAGGDRVADHWVTDTTINPDSVLLARVELPLGSPIHRAGSVAKVHMKHTEDSEPSPRQLVIGTATVQVDVRDPYFKTLEIGGVTLEPDEDCLINVCLRNLVPSQVRSKVNPPKYGDPVKHFPAYYQLLEQNATGPRPGMYADVEVGVEGGHTEARWGAAFVNVDPYQCTLGDGCLDGDPTC